jgi:hypothetical protein
MTKKKEFRAPTLVEETSLATLTLQAATSVPDSTL